METYGRPDAEAELWALIAQAIETPAASQTPDQQNVVAWFTSVVQREGVEAADDAGLEYTKWAGLGATNYEDLLATNPSESQLQSFLSGTPVPYGAGDSYNTTSSTSNEGYCDYVSPLAAPNPYTDNIYASLSSGGAEPQCFPYPCFETEGCLSIPYPSYDDFVQWGAVDADDSYDGNIAYSAASLGIADDSMFAVTAAVAATAGVAGLIPSLSPTVTGPVTADGPASVMVCASVLSGPLTIGGATGPVKVGGPAGPLCGADKVSGHPAVLGARGPVHIAGASVAGPILLMGDTGGLSVEGATSAGDLTAVGNTGRASLDGDTVEGALVASWGSGTLDIRSDRVGGGAEVSFNFARSAPTVSANTVGAGLSCEANTPADYGAANHVRGKATGQCAKLG